MGKNQTMGMSGPKQLAQVQEVVLQAWGANIHKGIPHIGLEGIVGVQVQEGMVFTQMRLPPLSVTDEGGQVGGSKNKWGGWVVLDGGDPDEGIDQLVNYPGGGTVDEDEEIAVVVVRKVVKDLSTNLEAGQQKVRIPLP